MPTRRGSCESRWEAGGGQGQEEEAAVGVMGDIAQQQQIGLGLRPRAGEGKKRPEKHRRPPTGATTGHDGDLPEAEEGTGR